MFKFVQNCTYLIFLLIQALKILMGEGKILQHYKHYNKQRYLRVGAPKYRF